MQEKKRVEIVCPKCGSNNIEKNDPISYAYSLACIAIGAVPALLYGSTAITNIFIIGGIISFILTFITHKTAEKGVWELKCKLCKTDFQIKEPKGDVIITNISPDRTSQF